MKKIVLFLSLIVLLSLTFYLKIPQRVFSPTLHSDINQRIYQVQETVAPKPTQILETGLPDKHLISTTFIPQAPQQNWDQPWQDACEEAAMIIVNSYYQNLNLDTQQQAQAILDLIEYETSLGWSHDINVSQMAQIARDYYHYTPEIIDGPTLNQIKTQLTANIPVIVPAAGKILFKENPNFRSGGPHYHSLVILGYDDTRSQFIVHDVGTRKGAYFRYSYDLLMQSIHDFPDTGRKEDILSGTPRVLLLLK